MSSKSLTRLVVISYIILNIKVQNIIIFYNFK